METLFRSKSHFWLCYCSLPQIMNQCATIQPCRPPGSEWLITPQYDSRHVDPGYGALHLKHGSHVLNAECFTTCSVMQIFLPFSLQGLLLNSGLTLQSRRCQKKHTQKKYRNKKQSRLGKVGCSLLFCFFLCLPFEALCRSLPRRLPNAAGMIWCQRCSSAVNFLDHKRTRGTDKPNPRLLSASHSQREIRNNPKIIYISVVSWLSKLPEMLQANLCFFGERLKGNGALVWMADK